MTKKNEAQAQANQAVALFKRIGSFKKDMTMREVRLVEKCKESSDDVAGMIMGILWIMNRRSKPDASFDQILDMTETAIVEELEKRLPQE